MNADHTGLYLMKSGALLKNQSYGRIKTMDGPLVPPDKLVRETMKSNGAQELPLGGLACDCPRGDGDPNCCINKLGLK